MPRKKKTNLDEQLAAATTDEAALQTATKAAQEAEGSPGKNPR